MSSLPGETTLYLDAAGEAVCAQFHPAAEPEAKDTAVLLCPPFGWSETSSYRIRREWACSLALAGFPVLRLSLPSTGDSDGYPRDGGRLQAWIEAADAGARWLRDATGARRITAIGMQLGGIVVYQAVVGGAPIDDLVLWAVPTRGRTFLRHERAYSKLERAQLFEGLEQPPPLPPGELEAGGFLLSAETAAALEQVDLVKQPLPDAPSRRILLLERDGIQVDNALREAIARSGAKLSVAPGDGYGVMTSHPQRARLPQETIDRVRKWLEEAAGPGAAGGSDAAARREQLAAADSAVMHAADGTEVRESPLTITQPFGELRGILCEPAGGRAGELCALLLNAGAVRRIGPNRMWVEVARRWAARGVPTLRLDVEGIGDADGEPSPYAEDASLYQPALLAQVLAALDALEQRGSGTRFLVAGLCAGANWSLYTALADSRVDAALMLNMRSIVYRRESGPARDFRALLGPGRSWERIRRNAKRERVGALAGWVLRAPARSLTRPGAAAAEVIDTVLTQLRDSGKRGMLLFAAGEPLDEELARAGWMEQIEQWPHVVVERIAVRDHTMRPTWAQQQFHEAVDRALEREIALTSGAASR